MPLVKGKQLVDIAERNGFAVGAFNVNNLEIIKAIIESAQEERSPAILQASQGAIKYAGIDFIVAMVKAASEQVDVPLALHLDHGTSFEQNMQCIRKGFTSVMFDGSKYSLEENIHKTRQVVQVGQAAGVSVEGELGKIAGTEDDISVDEREAFMTDPKEAERFMRETEVDYLAVAIGTAHGPYKGEPKLDFDRLKKIRELTEAPIVMHGASGVPEESIKKGIELGVRKINIDTELRQAFTSGLKGVISEKPEEYDPRKLLGPAKDSMKEVIKEKMRLFGSSGKV
ncbi:class II fructose-1,6-bisphosphate aldolase [Natranaerobius thermophilus]|uniref:Fructose-bisphosphate aldolase n=1 Tax=Natranaerobius thermophilus (strain ATCC BAA-1301 / DSM 18059 / JW/NM-WN-LF) TaxID=457570 RepID=B2A3J6_NATTJ|nr:class II fructose-1,6-bisphosphate aldolase [Natranaerobius thermophilus]ACB86425.1 fructose-bisphosphate aldolase [Natranaerobius thermophilus JW/NM-WN-LF]